MRLSPTTCYYIRKLLCRFQGDVKGTAASKAVPTDALSNIDEVLQSLYPSVTEISSVIQRLESLVYLHKSIHAQTSLYANYVHELTKLEQQIFRLLAFRRLESD
ncbi:hypothetical protein [Stenomitos frigidus]|uniref:Uncharacterized protein n=1 Tax=Stenomitos frigidus ULC18 TaxID=2107698 RepID=A0A2T1E375_9CYAN|nr:hypothetical protein [Stenomitos frigidus]PSB27185.1 hypothetical protein C7B82_17070 [Stenomitos frigidus ULC18]